MPNRLQFLRMYLMALIADGSLAGAKTPAQAAKKAAAIFAKDLPLLLGELLSTAALNAGSHLSAAAFGKLNEVLADIGKRGVKSVWNDIREQYNRGINVKNPR